METWFAAVLFLVSLFTFTYLLSGHTRPLPPSPWGLPLLGHLPMLGNSPHRNLQRLANIYGPIMSIRLGSIPVIVVSSPKAAELFLKTHDTVFASRPYNQVVEFITYGKDFVFAKYGEYWRNVRKLCTIELLSSSKIESFKQMRKEEVSYFVESIKKTSSPLATVDITAKVESLVEDLSYRMIFGFKDDKFNMKSILKEAVRLAGAFNVNDYIPWLRQLDLQGLGYRTKTVAKVLHRFMEKIIDEHVVDANDLQEQHRDFIDVMLSSMETKNTRELHLHRDHITAIVLDMLAASIDTSSTTIGWVITELLKNQRVMKLVQEELENNVGLNRMVEETDLVKLKYLNAVIKESMRIHPALPLLVPHESIEDVTVNGYFIPKKSRLLINTWAIGRDTNVWSDNAEEFYPERFIGSNIDVHGQNFHFLPFGYGRRKCPGMQLGMIIIQLVVAQVVHCFNLQLPNGMSPDDLDMTETFGLTLPRANHLHAIPTYRLRI